MQGELNADAKQAVSLRTQLNRLSKSCAAANEALEQSEKSASGYVGVCQVKSDRFLAYWTDSGTRRHIGTWTSALDAALGRRDFMNGRGETNGIEGMPKRRRVHTRGKNCGQQGGDLTDVPAAMGTLKGASSHATMRQVLPLSVTTRAPGRWAIGGGLRPAWRGKRLTTRTTEP